MSRSDLPVRRFVLLALALSAAVMVLVNAFGIADVLSDLMSSEIATRSIAIIVAALSAVGLGLLLLKPVFLRVVSSRSEVDAKMGWQIASYGTWLVVIIILTISITAGSGVSLGILAGVLVFVLQRPLINLYGWLVIVLRGPYHIGDIIEINDKRGIVIRIGLNYTHLREVGNWMPVNLLTGRHTAIPNFWVVEYPILNMTYHNHYVWEAFEVTFTYESDMRLVERFMRRATETVVGESMRLAYPLMLEELELNRFRNLVHREPQIYIVPEDSGVKFTVAFFCLPHERVEMKTAISKELLKLVQSDTRAEIAYPHMELVDWRLKHEYEIRHTEEMEASAPLPMGGTLLVPVREPPSRGLVNLCAEIASSRDFSLKFLHLVPIGGGKGEVEVGGKIIQREKDKFAKILEWSEAAGVKAYLEVDFSRDINRSLMDKVRERHADLVLMLWGGLKARGFFFGRVIDSLFHQLPSDVMVVKDHKMSRKIKNILVLAGRGPNIRAAYRLLAEVAQNTGAKITMFTVAQSSQELKSGWDLVNEALVPLKEMKIDCEGRVVEHTKIVDAVMEEAQEHDLVVLGGSSETGLQAVMGTLPYRIAKSSPNPVMVYRARN